jgi:hypothetical protein
MMKENIELYLYLHSIENGQATLTKADSIVGKFRLPVDEIQITMTDERPRRALVRIPRYLIVAKNIMNQAELSRLDPVLEGELETGIAESFAQAIRMPDASAAPAAPSSGLPADAVKKISLLNHRARSITEQLRDAEG